MHNFLYNTEITKEKFSISLSKIINGISYYRRDGNHMLKDILRNIIYKKSKILYKYIILYTVKKILVPVPEY